MPSDDGDEGPNCPIPSICQLCEDGSCATPQVEVVDGQCGPITYTCAAPTSDSQQPDTSTSSEPVAPSPDTEPPDCAVPAICQVCDDGSCASARVERVNGQCGEVMYTCNGAADMGPPVQPRDPGTPDTPPMAGGDPGCPVPAICQVCDDGSCASARVERVNGQCGEVTFMCDGGGNVGGPVRPSDPGTPDTPPTAGGDPGCSVPAICQLCPDDSCATPEVEVVDGACGPITYSCPASTGDASTGETQGPEPVDAGPSVVDADVADAVPHLDAN